MARLSDVSKVYRSVGFVRFARRVWSEVNKDNLFVWASALAYSWLFAVFPFFIFLLSLIPYLPGATAQRAREDIHDLIYKLEIPQDAADTIWRNVDRNVINDLHDKPRSGALMYVGLLVALWAASGGTAMTMSALDRVYELERGRSIYVHRLVAVQLTVAVAVLLLCVVCLLPVATLIKSWIIHMGKIHRGSPVLIAFDVARWAASVLLMIFVLTAVYYKGVAVKHRFTWVTPGALFVVTVWVVLGLLFRLYVDRIGAKGYSKTYGTVGGVAILLLFFYIDALVLLIGAEINSEIDFEVLKVRRGARVFRHAEDISGVAPTAC